MKSIEDMAATVMKQCLKDARALLWETKPKNMTTDQFDNEQFTATALVAVALFEVRWNNIEMWWPKLNKVKQEETGK